MPDNLAADAPATGAPATGFWRPLKTRAVSRAVMFLTLLGLGQWAFYGIFRCPFIIPYVQCQNCPVVTCHGRILNLFWGFWGGMLLLAVLLGRSFCGWFCPGGTVNRVLGSLSKLRLRPGGLPARLLPYGKYVFLALALYLVFMMLQPRVNVPIRVGEFFPAVAQTFEFAEPVWIARTLFIVGVLLLGVALPAAWCKWVCPAGGALELVKRFSLFRVFKTEACDDCDQCRKACYMDTRPEETDCTNCGDCIGSCPQECIGLGRKPQS